MAYCDRCGNFDESHRESMDYPKDGQHCIQDYQPDLYYYWDYPIEEDYDWRDTVPHADCLLDLQTHINELYNYFSEEAE